MPVSPARVLLAEDEDTLREALAAALTREGLHVAAVADGAEAAALAASFCPDIAVLDVMLPGEDGLTLARRLRRDHELPILLLTARDEVEDRLAGFDAGADDYVGKPFVLQELLARVRALLRRSGRAHAAALSVGDLLVDEAANRVVYGGAPVALTATELRLLGFLARHPGQVFSKLQLLTQVWGYEHYDPNVVEVQVSALRRKLEAHGPRVLHTARGLGYQLRA
jgi:two-component system, OmpR family, response regulator